MQHVSFISGTLKVRHYIDFFKKQTICTATVQLLNRLHFSPGTTVLYWETIFGFSSWLVEILTTPR